MAILAVNPFAAFGDRANAIHELATARDPFAVRVACKAVWARDYYVFKAGLEGIAELRDVRGLHEMTRFLDHTREDLVRKCHDAMSYGDEEKERSNFGVLFNQLKPTCDRVKTIAWEMQTFRDLASTQSLVEVICELRSINSFNAKHRLQEYWLRSWYINDLMNLVDKMTDFKDETRFKELQAYYK